MSNVITFPTHPPVLKLAGMVDVLSENQGMVLVDACLPTALWSTVRALLETAGVPIADNQ